VKLADFGIARAIAECPDIALGVNVADGAITHPAVAEALGTIPAEGASVS
jgi:alanine dehydrogenase